MVYFLEILPQVSLKPKIKIDWKDHKIFFEKVTEP